MCFTDKKLLRVQKLHYSLFFVNSCFTDKKLLRVQKQGLVDGIGSMSFTDKKLLRVQKRFDTSISVIFWFY